MRIAYNNYKDIEVIASGAALYYQEVSELLKRQKQVNAINFEFDKVLDNSGNLPKLNKGDVLITNSGPYSWFYYWLREKRNADYSIIHDIQTSLFSDFLLQQQLCNDLMREGDKILFLSEFQRRLYMKLFPDYLNDSNCFVCNPLLSFFPNFTEKRAEDNQVITLGYIGRVFSAKNFDQALEAFINASREIKDRKIRMIVAGRADKEFIPERVKNKLEKSGIKSANYLHINNGSFVKREEVWNILRKIDLLLFPSTANIESLGRAILEANNFKVPVIASNHAAASEVLPDSNLVPVEYFHKVVEITKCLPLGRLDDYEFLDKICEYDKIGIGSNENYVDHDKKLFRIINNEVNKEKGIEISGEAKDFIESCEIEINSDYSLSNSDARKKAIELLIKASRKKKVSLTNPSNDIFSSINYYPKSRLQFKIKPKLIVVEVTRRCNRNCRMCYNYNNQNQRDGLSTYDLIRFMKHAKRLGAEIISLTGGEPLLRGDIFEIIETISKLGMTSVIFTNGWLINEESGRKLINAGLNRLFFSIDSCKKEVNDYLRGPNALEKIVEAMKVMIKLRKEMKSKIELRAGVTVSNKNLTDLLELTNFCKSLGLDGVTFKPIRIHNGIVDKEEIKIIERKDINRGEFWINPSRYNLLDETIDSIIAYKNKNGFIWDRTPYLRLLKRYFKTPNNKMLELSCYSSDYFCVLDKDGNILPCWGTNFGGIGNIKQESFENIWNSYHYRQIRERMVACPLPCYNLIIKKTYLR